MTYRDPSADLKARRAEQERIMAELVAGVDNLLGSYEPLRIRSNYIVPKFVDGVIRQHPDAEAFVAEGIADLEAMLDGKACLGDWDGGMP